MIAFLFNRMAVLGIGFGLAVSIGLHPPNETVVEGSFAISLAIIGAIYLGTLLNQKQTRSVQVQEIALATVTFGFVAMGSFMSVLWLVPGFYLHAFWNWAHHDNRLGAKVMAWYPPFCVWVDLTIGSFVLWWYWPL